MLTNMMEQKKRGYGDFGGLGTFNDFGGGQSNGRMDKPGVYGNAAQGGSASYDDSYMGGGVSNSPLRGGGGGGGGGGELSMLRQEMQYLRQDNEIIKEAVIELEKDRDALRFGIRKLKVENSRLKTKLKRVAQAVGHDVDMEAADDLDYDEIKDFILVGGPMDPFSLRFEAPIRDAAGVEHKSAERYYWYKMAQHFGDADAAKKILEAPNAIKAEDAMKTIKGFDEAVWNGLKMQFWEEGQRLKMDQVRWIQNLLIQTDKVYIACASQDKLFGTGWRKNRPEAASRQLWDGENGGGKALMKMREELKAKHKWDGPYEEQEAEKKCKECRRSIWRRLDNRDQAGPGAIGGPSQRGGGGGPRGRGGRGGGPRGRGMSPRGFPAKRPRM